MSDNKVGKKAVRIAEIHLKHIEQIIGVEVDANEKAKFASFSDIDELTKSRVRDIYSQSDELRAQAYLIYLLPKNIDRSKVFSFLFEVIIEGMNQEEWKANYNE